MIAPIGPLFFLDFLVFSGLIGWRQGSLASISLSWIYCFFYLFHVPCLIDFVTLFMNYCIYPCFDVSF